MESKIIEAEPSIGNVRKLSYYNTGSFTFPLHQGSGPQALMQTFDFKCKIKSSFAVLTGTDFGYSSSGDHHLGFVSIRLNTEIIEQTKVKVTAQLGVRDWSGDWDDPYQGVINFAVLAELDDNPFGR